MKKNMKKNLNWEETMEKVVGVLKTDANGKIIFKVNPFGKFTATLKVADNTLWAVLENKHSFVSVDNLPKEKVKALQDLEAAGEISGNTRLAISGHLVRTPGNPGMPDFLNLKVIMISPVEEDEKTTFNPDNALTRDEWAKIQKEHREEIAARKAAVSEAPTAPTAPVAPIM